jgi:hypothetical protein
MFSQSGENQSFKLKDGTIINGTVTEENNDSITIQTQYGSVTINRSEILQTQYAVKLQSGETLIGTKAGENEQSITLITSMGTLTIHRSDIVNIQEVGKQSSTGATSSQGYYRRPYGLTDLLFGGSKIDKDTDFALGEEQLTDLFFDPTGYTFKKSTLYLSGLSFGFGVTDNFQITTKWGGFFYGNLNLRPKYKVFEKGNWENQHALSVGAHYHTRWMPNKYEWKSGSINVKEFEGDSDSFGAEFCPQDEDEWADTYCWQQTELPVTEKKYWGGYYKIGENPSYNDPTYSLPEGYDSTAIDIYYDHRPYADHDWNADDYDQEENFMEMIELFGAYTYSKARQGLKGRISHTLGGNMQYITLNDEPNIFYRVYYGLDVDINRKLKMIGELFYDPYYLELWQNLEYENNYWNLDEFSDDPVSEPDDYRPVHLDFGFMYAVNESFRFGIHFQKPFIAFYWKL